MPTTGKSRPAVQSLRKVKKMSVLQKIILAAVLVLPLALYAQQEPKITVGQAQAQTYVAESTTDTSHSPSGFKRAIQKVLRGLNPAVWMAYLSKRGPCNYAYQQAYGVCESKAPVR
jgi:hypothetical protein